MVGIPSGNDRLGSSLVRSLSMAMGNAAQTAVKIGRERICCVSGSLALYTTALSMSLSQIMMLAYRVGLITRAPTSFFRSLDSLRMSFSSTGRTNARVLPDPVTASTTTSLFCMNSGMVDACTGVILVWPIDCTTSKLETNQLILPGDGSEILHPRRQACRKRRPGSCERRSMRHGCANSCVCAVYAPRRVVRAGAGHGFEQVSVWK